MNLPVMIYVCKAKPYLYPPQDFTQNKWKLRDVPEFYIPNGAYYREIIYPVNDFVCFECECKEAEKFNYVPGDLDCDDFRYLTYEKEERWDDNHIKRSGGIDEYDLRDYSHCRTIYALHFESIKAIDNLFPVTELYSDEACTKPLKRAPQSWGYAYRKIYIDEEDITDNRDEGGEIKDCLGRVCSVDEEGFYHVEKVLVFSIQSTWCCKYGNGEKDLEIRTRCPKEIKKDE